MTNPIIFAIPVFTALIVVEGWWDARRQAGEYERRDTFTNIAVGTLSVVWGALLGLFNVWIYEKSYSLTPLRVPTEAVWAWALLFVLDDFCYYWFHRISHEVRFFWNFHVVHHSSHHYNLSVAVRQSWFSGIGHWVFYVPLMWLGFPVWMFATVHAVNLIYQFWIHTRFIKTLGPLEYVLNTPAHHRVHHGINNPYLDKNYGGILIIWDRLFGSFVPETEPPRYGIIKPIESYNWWWINWHGWDETFRAMRTRPTWAGKLRCLFGPPAMESRNILRSMD